MIKYIADPHFGHKRVIEFDRRPFSDVDEMDRFMIEAWNGAVQDSDTVYIVGDFCYKSRRTPDWYLKRLNGHKNLIIGNHDGKLMKNPAARSYIESFHQIADINDDGREVILCHYPIIEWSGMRHGSYHVYGHIHANTDEAYQAMCKREKALNAAACITGYAPATLDELIVFNKAFQEKTTSGETGQAGQEKMS